MGMSCKVAKAPRSLREETIGRLSKSRTGQRSSPSAQGHAREGVEGVEISVGALGGRRGAVVRRSYSGAVHGVLGSWIFSPNRMWSLRERKRETVPSSEIRVELRYYPTGLVSSEWPGSMARRLTQIMV